MKKILVTGGMLTYMVLFNAGITSAQNLPDINASDLQSRTSEQNIRREKQVESKITNLAIKLGVDPEILINDINSGKSTKDILKKHGISSKKLKNVLNKKRARKHYYQPV